MTDPEVQMELRRRRGRRFRLAGPPIDNATYPTCLCGHCYINHDTHGIPGKQRCKAGGCKCRTYIPPEGNGG